MGRYFIFFILFVGVSQCNNKGEEKVNLNTIKYRDIPFIFQVDNDFQMHDFLNINIKSRENRRYCLMMDFDSKDVYIKYLMNHEKLYTVNFKEVSKKVYSWEYKGKRFEEPVLQYQFMFGNKTRMADVEITDNGNVAYIYFRDSSPFDFTLTGNQDYDGYGNKTFRSLNECLEAWKDNQELDEIESGIDWSKAM